MRRVVVAGLIAAAGCRQLLGIEPAGYDDGDGGVDPGVWRIRLTAVIANTRGEGFTDPMLEHAPIEPPPAVQVGRIGGPLVEVAYGADGTVAYSRELAGAPWRLVYTPEDGIPREVQWSPPEGDLAAHVVEPRLGRRARMPVPAGSGYAITPVNSPAQHALTRVFTTGVWTEGVNVGTSAGATFNYDFGGRARPLDGPLGAPERARYDHGVLADFRVDGPTGCRVTSGTATFVVPDLVAGSLAAPSPQPAYTTAAKQVALTLRGPAPVHGRMVAVLGGLLAGDDAVRWEYGYAPSLGLPGFARPASQEPGAFALPAPWMIAFADCAYPESGTPVLTSPTLVDSAALRDRFPQVVHVEVSNARTVRQQQLRSGFSAVMVSSTDMFTSEFLAAAPVGIRLQRGTSVLDLVDGPDGGVIPAGDEPIEVSFELEGGAGLGADHVDIVLRELQDGASQRRRIYTVTGRALSIDPADLTANTEYVLELRSYRGRPEAARGNFAVSTYPQYAATVVTRTFKTLP